MVGEEDIKIARAVYKAYYSGYSRYREDLISEGVLGILRGRERWQEGTGCSLGTYLWACAKNGMSMYLKGEKRARELLSGKSSEQVAEYIADEESEREREYEMAGEVAKITSIANCMGTKAKQVIDKIMRGENQKDIARTTHRSRQNVSSMFVKFKNRVIDKYDYEDGELINKNIRRNERDIW